MAGLCAAARARELGLAAVVLEKGDRVGGSMLLSSCVVWRHRSLDEFRAECSGGDPVLQRAVFEGVDEGLGWLESLGAPVIERVTGNPRTTGVRFEPRGLTEALARAAGDVRLRTSLPNDAEDPLVLATGGFGAELARRRGLALRGNRWSEGDGLRFARARGAATAGDPEEFYGRVLPAVPVPEHEFVRAAQLYGRFAVVLDAHGAELPVGLSWSEVELPQALARAGGSGWLAVDGGALDERVRGRSVADMVAVAEELGAEVRRSDSVEGLGFPGLRSARLAEPPFAAVSVCAGVTHTLGGLRVDERARVLREDGSAIEGLYAAGADVGGIATGGYASGLAAALVLGRIASETAAAEWPSGT
jgi:succinate dehydrogenase/fumarate reductase flavoprotein subunit